MLQDHSRQAIPSNLPPAHLPLAHLRQAVLTCAMPDMILILNAGSSSVKMALFEVGAAVARGKAECGDDGWRLVVHGADGGVLDDRSGDDPAAMALDWALDHAGEDALSAVGHRIVHGGPDFCAPVRVTGDVLDRLQALTPLAPLHQPPGLAPIRAIMARRPDLPQAACFDTAFHHTMPPVATRLPLPRAYADRGVRRYGFHGLSYEHIAARLPDVAPGLIAGRVVVAHLGNGASLCAMQAGRSVDTTMSFTALDGLMMGTRCGALDPGVLLYMMQHDGLSPQEVEQVLYRQSGLLGVSGLSSDMRALSGSGDPRAQEAVALFVHRVAQEAAAMAASMGGIDGFVFTGGIGEHDAAVRATICDRLRWMGRIAVHVIPADEEAVIARHTQAVLR